MEFLTKRCCNYLRQITGIVLPCDWHLLGVQFGFECTHGGGESCDSHDCYCSGIGFEMRMGPTSCGGGWCGKILRPADTPKDFVLVVLTLYLYTADPTCEPRNWNDRQSEKIIPTDTHR